MKTDDYLMKKWCFGLGRGKTQGREEARMGEDGELNTYRSYPKYRTIVFKVDKATKKDTEWHVEGTQFASLTAKPKKGQDGLIGAKRGVVRAGSEKAIPTHPEPRNRHRGWNSSGGLAYHSGQKTCHCDRSRA